MPEQPRVPLTLEGSSVLHQLFRFDWKSWKTLAVEDQHRIVAEAAELLSRWEKPSSEGHPNQSAVFSLLGHKGDLMFVHFRDSFADLNRVELELAQTKLNSYLQPSQSYLSMVELGLYESSAETYGELAEKGLEPGTADWNAGVREVIERQTNAMAQRLYPAIPSAKYVCFYPMDRKRGEQVNWYTEPMADRQRMMHEHLLIGRRYADSVRQIITGSIGFDDREWGVDLFSEDPFGFQEADLRDALRSGQCCVRTLRTVFRRSTASCFKPGSVARRAISLSTCPSLFRIRFCRSRGSNAIRYR